MYLNTMHIFEVSTTTNTIKLYKMEFKGTKGEWHNNGLEVRSQSGMILANVYKHLPINQSKEEAIANAQLIAAAPELLDALIKIKSVMPFHDGEYTEGEAVAMIALEKAINKALNK